MLILEDINPLKTAAIGAGIGAIGMLAGHSDLLDAAQSSADAANDINSYVNQGLAFGGAAGLGLGVVPHFLKNEEAARYHAARIQKQSKTSPKKEPVKLTPQMPAMSIKDTNNSKPLHNSKLGRVLAKTQEGF